MEAERLNKQKENNAWVLQIRPQLLPEYVSSFKAVSIQALHNITLDKKLLVYYGNRIEFHMWSRS